MSFEVRQITDKEEWENFCSRVALDNTDTCKLETLLHSWNWGAFQEKLGAKIFRHGVFADNQLVAIGLTIKVVARRGVFLHCPHGPIMAQGQNQNIILQALLKEWQRLATTENCHFIRVSPIMASTPETLQIFSSLGFRNAPIHMHPELSWMLDITKPEDQLLQEMRKTTRYSIKKAEKDGVTIHVSQAAEDLDKFWQCYQDTVQRQNFTPFSKNYLTHEFETFNRDNQALFFLAEYEKQIISSAIIIIYQGTGFYHQGASIQKYAKIPASYLLQWQVIKELKKRGAQTYNFWGVSPEDQPKHPWAGLSLFKKGFGGYPKQYIPTQDYILNPLRYYLNFAIETLRKYKRGL
ncbi:MAG: peptidoglycan bridge formation glycyltransferase FemA/FemB family protein [Candidatus Magasanikbacteria bacterium]|nr:peptidoglycan bridge formation glycyltransferase FemA/FemB family protein [Candidatus Magasanikbacteria bacterium]